MPKKRRISESNESRREFARKGRQIMRQTLFAILVAAVVALYVAPARATMFLVDLMFDDPLWSGQAVYDDTTGQPWADPNLTVFEVTSMSITDPVGTNWDETELVPDPERGIIVDPTGDIVLFLWAVDTDTGLILTSGFSTLGSEIAGAWVITPLGYEVPYTASASPIPELNSAALFCIGLCVVGMALRERVCIPPESGQIDTA